MTDFKMPSLGADMEAGTLVAWHKHPGDAVTRGELIAEVETDKGIIEIEAFATGILERLVVPEGEKVPVGTVLAVIREDGADQPGPALMPAPPVTSEPASAPESSDARQAERVAAIDRIAMSPSARRLARELGVEPQDIHGTGPHGAITREDVERAAVHSAKTEPVTTPAAPVATPADATERTARMRQAIAAAMSRSKREIPHYYLSTTIDLQPALDWVAEQNLNRPITERLLYGVLLVKAVALALHNVPELNSVWEGDRAVQQEKIHIGVAISLRQGGLIAPALHDVNQKSIDQLMAEFRDLVTRARGGGLRGSELSDPTITVTSLGEQGVEAVFGVIYPPQTAIVGFGKVVERPWSIGGQLLSRQVITATLSADHRVSDGHRGGRFLAAIERLLQEPGRL